MPQKKLLPPSCHQRANDEKGRNEKTLSPTGFSFGGAEGIRTLDLLNAIPIQAILVEPDSNEQSLKKLSVT